MQVTTRLLNPYTQDAEPAMQEHCASSLAMIVSSCCLHINATVDANLPGADSMGEH